MTAIGKYYSFAPMSPAFSSNVQHLQVAEVMRVQPLTSVTCERGFSTMGRVKTKLRNRISSEHVVQHMRVQASNIPVDEFGFQTAMRRFRQKVHRRPKGRVNRIPAEQLKVLREESKTDVLSVDDRSRRG